MNIFLIPYTWPRHLQVGLFTGTAGLLTWWVLLLLHTKVGAPWGPAWDGAMLMSLGAAAIAGTQVLAEGNLRRQVMLRRVGLTAGAAALSGALALGSYWAWEGIFQGLLFPEDWQLDAADPTLASNLTHVGAWAGAGLATGMGPAVVRKGKGFVSHALGGLASGLAAMCVWQTLSFTEKSPLDLYSATAAGMCAWGLVFGWLAWGIPDELYRGWIRVLTHDRHGLRIPVDGPTPGNKERFIGHFPRGLDLWLSADSMVNELHLSVVVDAEQSYRARGLTLQPTVVRRFLEQLDLRYDPRRPAPLETRLHSGDRITLGQGDQAAVVEFLMLPKEES